MGTAQDKLIHLHERVPQRALEGLNRVTGLNFRHWPESLAPATLQEEGDSVELPAMEASRALPG